jgi:hypothetical protein
MELSAKLGLDGSAFKAGLDKAKAGVASLRSSLNSSASAMAKSSIAQVVGVAAVIQYARSTLEMGGQISDTVAQLGISAEELQRWTYAAGLAGAGAGEVASFFEKLTLAKAKALAGDKAAIASFKALGVSMDNLTNKKVKDIARMVAATMATGDIAELTAPLLSVGGKSAGKLIPTFLGDLESVMAAAPVMSDAAVAKLDEAGDAIDKAMLKFRSPMADLLTTIIPLFQNFVDGLKLGIATFKDLKGIAGPANLDTTSAKAAGLATTAFPYNPVVGTVAAIVKAINWFKSDAPSEVSKLIDEKVAEITADEARAAAETRAKAAAATPPPEVVKPKPIKLEPLPPLSPTIRDSLSQIGGFTMAQNREVLDVQKEQVSLLEKIVDNTDKIEAPEPVDDGL